MKICRFSFEGMLLEGVVHDDRVIVTDPALQQPAFPLSQVKILPPVVPSKIVCVGRNYADHAAELGNQVPKEPLLFLKAPSAIIGNGETIRLPSQSTQVEHEGELAVVIGRTCKDISENDDVLDYVRGFTCLNDVTARDLQKKDVQFTRAKSFDTFCPVGPFIETEIDLENARLATRVNGEQRQSAKLSQMVFPVDYLIRDISNVMTLVPGDVIATGTPAGVGKLQAGDVCEVEIDGVGVLRNSVE
jgi:2-keto-4-pentenoate hydratase/2-oxohepta-3-ene-1,7-dioic acid hydratase in catechol pathway